MKMRNYLVLMAFALISTTSMVACSKSSDDNSVNNNNNRSEVTMRGLVFSPASLQVVMGTTVTWRNNDNVAHTVTANDGSFDSGDLGPGATFTHTFSSTGTIPYHCNLHTGMTGTIVVVTK